MQRLTAASCMLLALLAGASLRVGAEHLKIAVVQTHTGVKLGTQTADLSADSDPLWTRCDAGSGTYSKTLGFHCGGATPLLAPVRSDDGSGYALFYDVDVVMPNQDRVVFHCSTILDPGCEGFPTYPESTSVLCSDFVYGGTAYKDCIATGQSANGIGVYEASLRGHRMTIYGAHWRRKYSLYGAWRDANEKVLEAKLAPPPDPKPDPKPDPPQESKPAPAQNPTPDPAQESKPVPAQDPKPDPPQ